MSVQQLTVLGAGLMGGSVALAARKAGWAKRIVAIDRKLPPGVRSQSRPEFLSASHQPTDFSTDPFDAWCEASDEPACETWLAETDLAVLAMPVSGIGAQLHQVLKATKGCVTDIGSTKGWLVASVQQEDDFRRYVPGHPMAGHPVGGLNHARADLFVDRPWIICAEYCDKEHLEKVRGLIFACGAHEVLMSPAEHDHAVARTSHIPQIVASALTVLANGRSSDAIGPGFLSATRVAGGAEEMWKDIFATNHEAIASGLKDLLQALSQISNEFESYEGKQSRLSETLSLLEKARKKKELK